MDCPVHDFGVLGTIPYPSKFCCWSCTILNGVKPDFSMAKEYNKGFIVEPTCLLVLILTWSYLNVLKSIPPTHALTSPVKGSTAKKPVCSICLWYFNESIGVMMVSMYLFLFHAKTRIGKTSSNVFLMSVSSISSRFKFLQRSVCLMANSNWLLKSFQTAPVLILACLLNSFCK